MGSSLPWLRVMGGIKTAVSYKFSDTIGMPVSYMKRYDNCVSAPETAQLP